MTFHSGGGRSAVLNYCSSTPSDSGTYLYNTINATYGGGAASGAMAWEHTATGSLAYTGDIVVGNILIGNNSGFAYAEIIMGTTTAQSVAVTFREFKYNAYDSVYVLSGSSVTYPYTYSDSNKNNSTAFLFVDSANGDFRLSATSAMLNCGDSIYAVQAFGSSQASKAMFDIGYYQSYTTGTCGGAPSTPTGACCYNYTCAVMTEAQCTALSGVYQGDGTSTCVDCTAPSGTNPSPYSKQLKIASLCYYAPWWTPNNIGGYVAGMRDWAANRYAMLITTGGTSASVSYMKGINPNLKVLQYSLFGRHTTDTATLRSLAVANGINFRDAILHTGTADVTTYMPTTGSGYGTYQSVTTTADSSPIVFSYWINTQRRVSLDPRRWQSGALLWHKLKAEMANDAGTSDDLDGIMLDEEQRWTGLFPGEAPILPTDGDTWASSIINPFNGITAFADSQKSWRQYWAKTLGDSARANNKIIAPNGTNAWGMHQSQADSGWKVEGRHASVLYGAAFLEESHGTYWRDNTTFLSKWPQMAYQLRDSAVTLILSYIPQGPPSWWCTSQFSKPRDKMMFLGFALMCTFERTNNSDIYFSPKWTATYNDVYHNIGTSRNFSCSTYTEPSDTLWEWSNAWGKYFGTASDITDTSQTGTDGAGQSYKVWKKAFTHPTTGLTQTFVAMRFTSGTNFSATSNVNVALPGAGNWYELIENTGDSAGQGAGVQAFWRPTPYTGGSNITLSNAQARVFSADTVLANSGYSQSTTGTISIDDVSVTEGGTATFTVTLSQAQSVLTTFNYSTANGTALSGTDYTATSGSKSIPIGSTSTTITVPTTNRASCQTSRAFTVSLTNVSPATITIIDPTGTGTITDDDCGTTYRTTYKGKIVIKGKVKP
jgi:hypothetical protein